MSILAGITEKKVKNLNQKVSALEDNLSENIAYKKDNIILNGKIQELTKENEEIKNSNKSLQEENETLKTKIPPEAL